jgi:hypothetical protein
MGVTHRWYTIPFQGINKKKWIFTFDRLRGRLYFVIHGYKDGTTFGGLQKFHLCEVGKYRALFFTPEGFGKAARGTTPGQ